MCPTQIICLANSAKYSERCVASIEPDSRQWIRPVSDTHPEDGRVPSTTSVIDDGDMLTLAAVELLDVLEIPLDTTGPDFDFECENRSILPGDWTLVRKANAEEVLELINFGSPILHNFYKYVPIANIQALLFPERKTLELVYTDELTIISIPRRNGGTQWKGSFFMRNGLSFTELTITDNALLHQLDKGAAPEGPCLITLSLSLPHEFDGWTGPPNPCWKLIAGVIELSLDARIRIEMKLSGWDVPQARQHIQQTYQKNNRQEMTDEEKIEFINYLREVNEGS